MKDKDDKIQSPHQKKGEDSRLWEEITRDIKPLENRKNPETTATVILKKPLKSQKVKEPAVQPSPQKKPISQKSELDHRTAERLRKGQMPIEARLDLHGMTREQAYESLSGFIPRCHARGFRCLLIITGKGSRGPLEPETGILKQKIPEWLENPPLEQYVLRVQISKQKDGGTGAFYVLLKRSRD